MKYLLILPLLLFHLNGEEINGYATVGILSHHFDTNEGEPFNENHKAYGAEIDLDQRYALAYLHMINSRGKETDIGTIGYRYNLYGPFGIYGVVGYQRGYCFDGLKSVECTEGKENSGVAFMPMLYYRHNYFTLDLIAQDAMIALKLNLKLF
ncbi:MAG: hypothetical protein Q8K81_07095 [Sulfuricurvum sp.]|nr:hypothetical protein [Sulfuricurvum sp.]